MREGNIFSLSTPCGGGGGGREFPVPGLDGGGTPSQVWTRGYPILLMGEGVYPIPGLDGGYAIPGLDQGYPILLTGGDTPLQDHDGGNPVVPFAIQDWMGHPPPHPGLDGVPPPNPRLDGVPLPPPFQDWMGYPPSPSQQSEHLLRGGRRASCVHAGGLSCFCIFLVC